MQEGIQTFTECSGSFQPKKIDGLGQKKSKGLGVRKGWQKECGSLHTKQEPTTEQDPTDLCTQGI